MSRNACKNIDVIIEICDDSIKISRYEKNILRAEKLDIGWPKEDNAKKDKLVFDDNMKRIFKNYLDANNFSVKNAAIILKSVASRFIDLPGVYRDELDGIIQINLPSYLPINFDNYIVDYKLTHEDENGCKIMLVAVKKSVVEEIIELFKNLGVQVICIDTFENCLGRYFLESCLGDEPTVIVDEDKFFLSFIFMQGGEIKNIRSVPFDSIAVKDEIEKLFNYYATINLPRPQNFYLNSKSSCLKKYFSSADFSVECLEGDEEFKSMAKRIKTALSSKFKEINLLPQEYIFSLQVNKFKKVFAFSVIVCVLFCTLINFLLSAVENNILHKVQDMSNLMKDEKFSEAREIARQVPLLREALNELEETTNLLDIGSNKTNEAIVNDINFIFEATQECELNFVSEDSLQKVTISGTVNGEDKLISLMDKLKANFKNIDVKALNTINDNLYQFTFELSKDEN